MSGWKVERTALTSLLGGRFATFITRRSLKSCGKPLDVCTCNWTGHLWDPSRNLNDAQIWLLPFTRDKTWWFFLLLNKYGDVIFLFKSILYLSLLFRWCLIYRHHVRSTQWSIFSVFPMTTFVKCPWRRQLVQSQGLLLPTTFAPNDDSTLYPF